MEISEIRNSVSKELERVKKIMEGVAEYEVRLNHMEFIKDCCFCIYWNCCPCGWSNGNAACITIQKPISEQASSETEAKKVQSL